MALIKEKETKGGYIANYWVANIMPDTLSKTTHISVMLFKDKEARLAGKRGLYSQQIGTMQSVYVSGEEVYNFIKQNEWFSDAVDDI